MFCLTVFLNAPNTFQAVSHNFACLFATISLLQLIINRSQNEITRIINKIQDRVCGYSSSDDMKTLPERNELWNADVQNQFSAVV